MTLHYHGTPITPNVELLKLKGKLFCVSFQAPSQVEVVHRIGQGVLLDNGAYTAWRLGIKVDWKKYYTWIDPYLDYPNTYAIIPDEVDGGEVENDRLLKEWPFGNKGLPVWHLHESLDRLLNLVDTYPKVCFGSSSIYKEIGSKLWVGRVNIAWDLLAAKYKRLPYIHMLRGMSLSGKRWPFASLDSTDVGRNHHRIQNEIKVMAENWDGMNCPSTWKIIGKSGFF